MSASNKLTVTIHFDLICPWCFIGKHQFAMARGKFTQMFPAVDVETVWQPVQLLPDVPASGLPFAEFYERRLGSPEAVRRRQKQVTQSASSVGLDLDLSAIERMPNTARAHHLLNRASAQGGVALYEALLDRLFAGYFQRGEDIGDAATLRALAAEVGLPSHIVDAAQADAGNVATTAAVEGVPHFGFNGRLSLSGARDAAILLMAMSKAVQVLPGIEGAGS